MDADRVNAIAGVITALAAIGGLAALWWQVHADHQRRRKQATIESWIATRERRRYLRNNVIDLRRKPSELDDALDTRRALNEWLSDIEFFCQGVNSGVFDLETIDRMSGSYFIRLWWWAGPWIKERQVDRSPLLYVELETLAKRLISRREANGTLPLGGFYDLTEPSAAPGDPGPMIGDASP